MNTMTLPAASPAARLNEGLLETALRRLRAAIPRIRSWPGPCRGRTCCRPWRTTAWPPSRCSSGPARPMPAARPWASGPSPWSPHPGDRNCAPCPLPHHHLPGPVAAHGGAWPRAWRGTRASPSGPGRSRASSASAASTTWWPTWPASMPAPSRRRCRRAWPAGDCGASPRKRGWPASSAPWTAWRMRPGAAARVPLGARRGGHGPATRERPREAARLARAAGPPALAAAHPGRTGGTRAGGAAGRPVPAGRRDGPPGDADVHLRAAPASPRGRCMTQRHLALPLAPATAGPAGPGSPASASTSTP